MTLNVHVQDLPPLPGNDVDDEAFQAVRLVASELLERCDNLGQPPPLVR